MIQDKVIEYKGRSFQTSNWTPDLSDEACEELRRQFYEKPHKTDVYKELSRIYRGFNKMPLTTKYYFREIMSKVHVYNAYWSVEEVFECNDLIRHFYAKTLKNDNVFSSYQTTIEKLETAIRLTAKPATGKATNFPLEAIDDILEKYNQNGVYYDPSCGWGVRMLGAMRKGIRYIGTDPNYLLTEQLEILQDDFSRVNGRTLLKPDIRTQGSEIFMPEYENKVGLVFTSPPYFFLENYHIGIQSCDNNTDYIDWKNEYLRPTISNIYQYLIDDGYFLFNIKDFLKYSLVRDTINIAKEMGFYYHGNDTLNVIKRRKMDNTPNHNADEPILIFSKKDTPPKLRSVNNLDSLFV